MLIIGMTSVILAGCQKQDEVTDVPKPAPSYVLADLALSLPASSASTRLSADVVQADGQTFRGIQKLTLIPFSKQGKVEKDDRPSYYSGFDSYIDRTTPALKEDFDPRFRYYDKVYLMNGVASFLTYGQATAASDNKAINGSLISKVAGEKASIPDRLTVTAGDLSFELETIYNEMDAEGKLIIPEEAQAIADYLTTIANAKVTVDGNEYSWSDTYSVNATLWGLYYSFISTLPAGKYGVIAGSAANVKAYVDELYTKLQELLNQDENFGDGSVPRAIAAEIKSKISSNTVLDTYEHYPENRYLPDGAAVLQWGKKTDNTYGFIPKVQTTNTANVSSMNRYTYPAELYYYGNSLIKTSNDEVPATSYSGKTTWESVVSSLYKSGSVVSSNTKAVAIVDPMQYAVARLQGTVQVEPSISTYLLDAEETQVPLTNGSNNPSFKVTGLIVSGQYPVNFDFTPKYDGASEDNEHFVYDSNLSSNPMYLTTTVTAPFYTLVMQTHDFEDVTVILELENNSGKDFRGENGIVYNGTKFYLAGKVVFSDGDANSVATSEQDDVSCRVFTQDHTTILNMKVKSLAKAYNVMPNIQSGRLEVGVEINLKWEQQTPQTIVFED
jgi:hypothetical protein